MAVEVLGFAFRLTGTPSVITVFTAVSFVAPVGFLDAPVGEDAVRRWIVPEGGADLEGFAGLPVGVSRGEADDVMDRLRVPVDVLDGFAFLGVGELIPTQVAVFAAPVSRVDHPVGGHVEGVLVTHDRGRLVFSGDGDADGCARVAGDAGIDLVFDTATATVPWHVDIPCGTAVGGGVREFEVPAARVTVLLGRPVEFGHPVVVIVVVAGGPPLCVTQRIFQMSGDAERDDTAVAGAAGACLGFVQRAVDGVVVVTDVSVRMAETVEDIVHVACVGVAEFADRPPDLDVAAGDVATA